MVAYKGRATKQQLADAMYQLILSCQQVNGALSAYHKERPEGEGLAFPMMDQSRRAIVDAKLLLSDATRYNP